MDAKAALISADQALSDGDLETACNCLQDYWRWRAGGGFQPELWGKRGDVRANEIRQRLDAAVLQSLCQTGALK